MTMMYQQTHSKIVKGGYNQQLLSRVGSDRLGS
jgi:hypothetical protein